MWNNCSCFSRLSYHYVCLESFGNPKQQWPLIFSKPLDLVSCELHRRESRVFWLNIAKFKVNWCYRYCFKLFSNLRKEKELRQYHCRNSTKVGERKIKSRREKFLIFGNGIAAIPFAHSAARVGKKNLAIVAMPLPKMKKKKCYEIYERVKKSCHVHNIFTIFSQ